MIPTQAAAAANVPEYVPVTDQGRAPTTPFESNTPRRSYGAGDPATTLAREVSLAGGDGAVMPSERDAAWITLGPGVTDLVPGLVSWRHGSFPDTPALLEHSRDR